MRASMLRVSLLHDVRAQAPGKSRGCPCERVAWHQVSLQAEKSSQARWASLVQGVSVRIAGGGRLQENGGRVLALVASGGLIKYGNARRMMGASLLTI